MEGLTTRLPFGPRHIGLSDSTTIAILCALIELITESPQNAKWVNFIKLCYSLGEVNPTTSRISLLLTKAEMKPRCNNKDIVWVNGSFYPSE